LNQVQSTWPKKKLARRPPGRRGKKKERFSAAVSQSGSLPGREYGRGTKKHLEYQGMVFHPLGIPEGNPKSIIPKELLLRLAPWYSSLWLWVPSWQGGPIPATSSGRLLRRRSNIPAVKTGVEPLQRYPKDQNIETKCLADTS
jgi:hypothetical protein